MIVYLHLGSNMGAKMDNIMRAISQLEEHVGELMDSSSFYDTAPWGSEDQDTFVNMALSMYTYLSPKSLLRRCQAIEDGMGRVRKEKWGERIIDIDILMMEDVVMATDELTIPHALMHERNFVLYPLCEIADGLVHPVLKRTMHELLDECTDTNEVRKILL